MMKSKRFAAIIGVSVLLLGLAAGFLTVVAVFRLFVMPGGGVRTDAPFSAARWKEAGTEQQKRRRVTMTDDIIGHRLRAGITQEEVRAVLGPPDRIDNPVPAEPPLAKPGPDRFQYDMGNRPMDFAGQHDLLRVYFDSSGRLVRVQTEVD